EVAQGREDYYLGKGEAPGRWYGGSAAALGLVGQVEPDDLRAVFAGEHPVTGERLAARRPKVAAFDLCFSPPKSVSVLFGLGDPDTARAVRDAHDRAVEAALGWLEANAVRTRR